MTLNNINNKKDKQKKVNLIVVNKNDELLLNMWFKNWECFMRTVAYQKYKDYDLEYCKIESFRNKSYIAVCVKN